MTNDKNYYKSERKSVAIHIPKGENVILDVGCGEGNFGLLLKNNKQASLVYGIELVESVAAVASKNLDNVVCKNLDEIDFDELSAQWNNIKFDYIVFNDVLEHTKDPWIVISSLKNFLSPEGEVIISIPNVRHWSVIYSLVINGDWRYENSGIMDKTHLRFFTKKSATRFINDAGLKIKKTIPLMGGRARGISNLCLGLAVEFLAEQYVLLLKK